MQNLHKKRYLIQPYNVGKDKKSLAIVIPSQIVKKYNLNSSSTIFFMQEDEQTNSFLLRTMDEIESNKKKFILDNGLELPSHQAIVEVH
jgi:antitoxin component of MazEF toxin-antitoxin module